MRLSAVLSVRDEEDMLAAGLELLGFCDEIVVVVDARSADATEEIARRYTDKVYVNAFETFADQRNFVIGKAEGDWVLMLDGDERVTPRLAAEIETALARATNEVAFEIEIVNYFLGSKVVSGGWKQYHRRLVRREHAVWTGAVHERLTLPEDRIARLQEGIWHFSHRTIQEQMQKAIVYGDLASAEMHAQGAPPVTVRKMAYVLTRDLFSRLLYRRAWKDGTPGIIECIFQPFVLFCTQVMLWQRQRPVPIPEMYERLEREAADYR